MKCFLFPIFILLNCHSGCKNNIEQKAIKESQKISKVWESQNYRWILSSLFIQQGCLFFGGLDNNFYCIDVESGKTKWKFKTKGECYFPPGLGANKIFFTSFDLFLYALDRDGKEIWNYKLPNRAKSSPVFSSFF